MGITQAVKAEALRLGFVLAGVTTPDPPPHYTVFESWVKAGRHAEMAYLASPLSLERRADPRAILSECRSILSLGIAYPTPSPQLTGGKGRVASYAWGDDYHDVLPDKLQALVSFIEAQLGKPVGNRLYTDSAPLL